MLRRPTLLFLFAAQVFTMRDAQCGLDLLGRLAAHLQRERVKANPAPTLLVAKCLDLCLSKGYAIADGLAQAFRETCLHAIADEIEVKARHALSLCLGRLGDPRIANLPDPAGYVEVPVGDYVVGASNQPIRIQPPLLLGRYPVTNCQYRAFMDAGGYATRHWWSDAGWAWRQQNGVTEPAHWQDRRWNGPNQPVVGVSFWEAEACCRWAGGRLPTEQEWEAAVRGPKGWEYPWGREWEDGICNSREAGLGVTSPVGLFPRSRQAGLALHDSIGNVWEWCDSFFKRSDADALRVLRGGASDVRAEDLRASDRYGVSPRDRDWDVGFHCVVAAPRQP